MTRRTVEITDNGGIMFHIEDGNGDVREVALEPRDDGNVVIRGLGPAGSQSGVLDVSDLPTPDDPGPPEGGQP